MNTNQSSISIAKDQVLKAQKSPIIEISKTSINSFKSSISILKERLNLDLPTVKVNKTNVIYLSNYKR